MSSCGTCTKIRPIKKTTSNNCKKNKQKIEEVRIYCPDSLVETISETIETGCVTGYVSNLINPDPLCNPVPIVSVDVENPEDIDELNEYSFDRTEDEGTDTWSLSPLKLKVRNPETQCTIDSWKGKDLAIIYKIVNKAGEWKWRRLLMKLVGSTGGLLSGYELTFDAENPSDAEKPLFVSFGDEQTTESALDALTDFDGTGGCVGILYSRVFFEDGNRIDVNDYTLPTDNSKILVFKNGLLMTEGHPEGYQISGNGIDILDPDAGNNYQIIVYA